MRILVVSQYFWPESFRINEVVKSLVEHGLTVDVLTGKPNYPEGSLYSGYRFWGCQKENYHGATVYRVPLVPRGKNSISLILNYISFVFTGVMFGPKFIRGQQYDAILVYAVSPVLQAIPALFFGYLKNIPVIVWVQDLWPQSLSATGFVHNRYILSAVEKMVRFIYHRADLLLIQSRAFEAPVSDLADGTPIEYFPNSVDSAFCNPSQIDIPHVLGMEDGFSVLFAGNIGTAQGVAAIVEAAYLLRDFSDINFVVLGDGSLRPWMVNEINQRDLRNLHLPGRFPRETMPGFMQRASVLLVTLADEEIFSLTIPNKVQAYLATGRPIIGCMRGEGARIINDSEAGLVTPPEDGEALAQAVLQLYNATPEERDLMGKKGQSYFEAHFNHGMLIGRLEEVFSRFKIKSEDR